MGQLIEWPEVITKGRTLEDCRESLKETIFAFQQLGKGKFTIYRPARSATPCLEALWITGKAVQVRQNAGTNAGGQIGYAARCPLWSIHVRYSR